jgi:hypothetical protein
MTLCVNGVSNTSFYSEIITHIMHFLSLSLFCRWVSKQVTKVGEQNLRRRPHVIDQRGDHIHRRPHVVDQGQDRLHRKPRRSRKVKESDTVRPWRQGEESVDKGNIVPKIKTS